MSARSHRSAIASAYAALAVLNVLAALTVLAALVILILACAGGPPSGVKPRTREELKTLLAGKTKAEVIEVLGRPEQTGEYSAGDFWTYRRVSFDPVAGRTADAAHIWFDRKGVVADITFV